MNVLHILHRGLADEAGGVQSNLWNLVPELERLEVRGEILLPKRHGWDTAGSISEGSIEDEEIDPPFPIHFLNLSGGYHSSFEAIYLDPDCRKAFREFLRLRTFDILHFHHLGGLSFDLPEVAAELDIPAVFTLHDYYPLCLRGQMVRKDGDLCAAPQPGRCAECLRPQWKGIRRPAAAGWLRALAPGSGPRMISEFLERSIGTLKRHIDRFVAPSEFTRQRYVQQGLAEDRIEVIPYGLKMPAHLPERPRASGGIRFGYLGAFTSNKGLPMLLNHDIQKAIQAEGGTLELYGGTMEDLLDLTDPPHPWVHVHGLYRPEQVWDLLARLDVLIVPSQWEETYNIVLREGLAAGLPIIANRMGGMIEALEDEKSDQVLGISPGSVSALENAIHHLGRRFQTGGLRYTPRPAYSIRRQAEAVRSVYDAVR